MITMSDKISCPVNHVLVNENQVRITASLVLLCILFFLFIPYWGIPAFLGIDFFLRGFGKGPYSPLNIISGWLVRKLSIKTRPTDQAPKLFAAQLGFVFADLLLISNVLSLDAAAYSIAAILILFSFLESVFGICAGCYAYTLFRRLSDQTDRQPSRGFH
ncbi:MAG TPA: DUF4395 domain-containing protein [Puia sp.]